MSEETQKALSEIASRVAGGRVAADAVDIAMRMHEAQAGNKKTEGDQNETQ